jgi:hypothetical protein
MVRVRRLDSYGRDMMIKIIFDVMKSDWPEEFKKHILLKELLWKADAPRGVRGDNSKIVFSKKAMFLWKNNKTLGKKPKSGIVIEHAVPRLAIYNALTQEGKLTKKSISDILDRLLIRVAVTKDEDDMLNQLGLRQKMPEKWEGTDFLARHREAKIEHVEWLPEEYEQ